jgi:chitinase
MAIPKVVLLAALGAAQAVLAQSVYPAWAPNTPYKRGDLVSYVGVAYLCLQAHTSQAGQEPPAAPALWRVYSGTPSEAPATPTGLVAVADGPSRIVVSWSQAQGADSYDLRVDGALVEGVTNPFIHKDLAQGSSHAYQVRAVNDAGKSAWSEPVACATGRARITSGR